MDVGLNAMQSYLSRNDYFVLKEHSTPDGTKFAEMVIQKKALDREGHPFLSLKLTAIDRGNPQQAGVCNTALLV